MTANDTVAAVYELREAAVEHGKALAELQSGDSSEEARDRLLETTLEVESKTIAALDECSEASDTAVAAAVAHA